MSGIDLREMEASDMLDVLHYLFEDDLHVGSAEEADAKDKVRISIYESMYNKTYKFANPKSSTDNDYGFDELDDPVNFSPDIQTETKPYFPPTDFNPDAANPFGGALRETPMG